MSADRVLFVGDVSWDTTAQVPGVPAPDEKVVATALVEGVGGVVANAAVAASLADADVALACSVGDDDAGTRVRAGLSALGINLNCTVVEGPTCRALVLLDRLGEKRLVLWPGATMFPSVDEVQDLDLEGVAWVHTAAYDVRAATVLARRCREAGIAWSVDLEPATMPHGPAELAEVLLGAQTVIVNDRAAAIIGTDPVGALLAQGVREVICSRGPGGASWTDGITRVTADAPRLPGPVRDTTGAGDALAGWFAALRVEGLDPGAALARAVLAASVSCTAIGAGPSYPRRSDLPLDLAPTVLTEPAT